MKANGFNNVIVNPTIDTTAFITIEKMEDFQSSL